MRVVDARSPRARAPPVAFRGEPMKERIVERTLADVCRRRACFPIDSVKRSDRDHHELTWPLPPAARTRAWRVLVRRAGWRWPSQLPAREETSGRQTLCHDDSRGSRALHPISTGRQSMKAAKGICIAAGVILVQALALAAVPMAGAQTVPAGRSAGGPQEGITVHGRWVVEVRNPDGTLASRTEFNNALASGSQNLVAMLSRTG